MKIKYGILFFLVLQTGFVYAVDDEQLNSSKSVFNELLIEDIRLEGLQFHQPEFILGNISLVVGDKLDSEKIQENFIRLLELDLFENVKIKLENGAQQNGRIIIFELDELPLVGGVVIEGASVIDAMDIVKNMNLSKDKVYRDSYIEGDKQAIANMYLEKGYMNVDIHLSANGDQSGMVNVLVRIDEHNPVYIYKVRVIGTKNINPDNITDLIKSRESQFYSSEILDEFKLDEDKKIIQQYAQSLGYYQARVSDVKIIKEPIPKKRYMTSQFGFTILIEIEEGPLFKLGDIEFLEEQKTIDNVSLISLKKGDVFNKALFEFELEKIRIQYYNRGYIRTRIIPEYKVDETNKQVNIQVQIFPGNKVHIKDIFIVGNDRTWSRVIDQEFTFYEGELFSYNNFMQTMRRIQRLDYFKTVIPEFIDEGEDEDELSTLLFKVSEKGTGTIAIGGMIDGTAALSSGSFMLYEKLAEKNIFGTGWGIQESLHYGLKRFTVELGTHTEWLVPYIPIHFSFKFRYIDLDVNVYDRIKKEFQKGKKNSEFEYSFKSFSFEANLGYALNDYWSIYMGFDLYFSRSTEPTFDLANLDMSLNSSDYLKNDLEFAGGNPGFHRRISHNLTLVYDSTNSRTTPTQGIKARGVVTYTGGIYQGHSQWIKLLNSYAFYFNPFWKVIFSYSLSYEMLFKQFDGQFELRELEQLRFNGLTELRGWSKRKNDMVISSAGKVAISQEIRFPFFGDIVWGIFFLDMGDISNSLPSLPMQLRYFSYGFGFQVTMSYLPITIYLAKKADYNITKPKRFHFHKGFEVVFTFKGTF